MNQKYTIILFDKIPERERKKALRNIKGGRFHGFRSLDAAPLPMLKQTLNTNEKFCSHFLHTVAKQYGCGIEQYQDEESLPELSEEIFWGIFAWKCYKHDETMPCDDLDDLLRWYEQLSTKQSEEGRETVQEAVQNQRLLLVSKDLTQNDEIRDENNLPVEETEEVSMQKMQYIGYIHESSEFYNFYPVYVASGNSINRMDESAIKEMFPTIGNVNLSSSNKANLKKKCWNGEVLVIELSQADLIENKNDYGEIRKTNYKVDYDQLERDGRIKRLADLKIYPVLHPVERIDFTKRIIQVKENYADEEDLCLIEEDNTFYGPYRVEIDENKDAQVQLAADRVVNCYRSEDDEIEYIKIIVKDSSYSPITTYNVCLDDRFVHECFDKISDQDLLKLFEQSLAKRKGIEKIQISADMLDECAEFELQKLPDEIVQRRVKRVKEILEEELKKEEVQDDIARYVAGIIYKFGESDYFPGAISQILDDSDLAKKLQTFAIVEDRLSKKREEYAELQQKCTEERKKMEADKEMQISSLAERTSEEIKNLTEKKEALTKEVSELQEGRDILKNIADLKKDEEIQKGINRSLIRSTDEAVKELEERLKEPTARVVDTAFDGRIADIIFQAAADWKRETQKTAFQKIAQQLTETKKEEISGGALVDYLLDSVRRYRPDYTRNDILNIFICISQNFLTVFSGEPGTGKTSICNIIAHVLGTSKIPDLLTDADGIEVERYVPISIERGWTSKRDFVGYYNPLSQTFEKANKHLCDGLCLLDQEGEQSRYPYIVLLDEANLSPIEYYWADFMNICDSDFRFNKISLGNDIQLQIPRTLRFVGTINNDDTTERLSPRLIDRAMLIRLPDVRYQLVEDEDLMDTEFVRVISWEALQGVFNPNGPNELDAVSGDIYKRICELFRNDMRIAVSPRVGRAVRGYWTAAKDLFESKDGNDTTIIALDYAVAQKLLPKINGSGEGYLKHLEKLREICEKGNLNRCDYALRDIIKRGKASMNYFQYF